MYLCADCSHAEAPIVWFEPNANVPGQPCNDCFYLVAPSFEEWLLAWLDGRDLLEEMIHSDETPEDRLWTPSE